MTYELAKQLKDAGFPFKRLLVGTNIPQNAPIALDVYGEPYQYFDFNPEGRPEIGAQHFLAPTLEELIEACGDGFHYLHRLSAKETGGDYLAHGGIENCECTRKECNGWTRIERLCKTPSEAVAFLWLALNNK